MKPTVFVAPVRNPAYDEPMAKAKKFDLEDPAPILDEEDEETLAAIDEGIRNADAGRVVSAGHPPSHFSRALTFFSSL
jgi:hypothetical protein